MREVPLSKQSKQSNLNLHLWPNLSDGPPPPARSQPVAWVVVVLVQCFTLFVRPGCWKWSEVVGLPFRPPKGRRFCAVELPYVASRGITTGVE